MKTLKSKTVGILTLGMAAAMAAVVGAAPATAAVSASVPASSVNVFAVSGSAGDTADYPVLENWIHTPVIKGIWSF